MPNRQSRSDSSYFRELPDFTRRLNDVSHGAFSVGYRRYYRPLCALVARALSPLLRRRADPDDLVQSAALSFFKAVAKKKRQIEHRGELWQKLAGFAYIRVLRFVERNCREKCNPTKEVYIDSDGLPQRRHSHEESVVEADLRQRLLQGLGPTYETILEMLLEGRSAREISAVLRVPRSQISAKINRLRQRVTRLLGDETLGI